MKRKELLEFGQKLPLDMADLSALDNWELIKKILPQGWEEKAWELGAMSRRRGILKTPEMLLRLLFMYLASDTSYKETVCLAEVGGLPKISSVALWKRLGKAGKWFCWIAQELLETRTAQPVLDFLHRRARLVDGTIISEPGCRKINWRVHYTINMQTLLCDFFMAAGAGPGESFCHIPVEPGDVLVGDRNFGNRRGAFSVLKRGGHVIVRVACQNFPLETSSGKKFNYLKKLENMGENEIKEWSLFIRNKAGDREKVRLCVYRRTKAEAEAAQKSVRKKANKRNRETQKETLEAAHYILVITTLDKKEISAEQVLEFYRGRWQIELYFKRIKSLIGIGHLPSKNPESALSWITGKILIVIILETLQNIAEAKSQNAPHHIKILPAKKKQNKK